MGRAEVQLLAPVGFVGGDFIAQLRRYGISDGERLRLFGLTYPRVAQETGLVLHLDGQLVFVGQTKETNALFADLIAEIQVDAGVLDIQETDIEQRIAELAQEPRFRIRAARLGKVKNRNFRESHSGSSCVNYNLGSGRSLWLMLGNRHPTSRRSVVR